MSDKIQLHHLERKAILYIRQSSLYQVKHNLESQKLQYAMEQRLQQLGWCGSKWWMMTWAGRLPGPSLAPALNAWWQKFVWEGGCSGRAGGIAIRTEQPRVATIDRSVSGGRSRAD